MKFVAMVTAGSEDSVTDIYCTKNHTNIALAKTQVLVAFKSMLILGHDDA